MQWGGGISWLSHLPIRGGTRQHGWFYHPFQPKAACLALVHAALSAPSVVYLFHGRPGIVGIPFFVGHPEG